jgi:hypothetical protein
VIDLSAYINILSHLERIKRKKMINQSNQTTSQDGQSFSYQDNHRPDQGRGGIFKFDSIHEKYRLWIEKNRDFNKWGYCHCQSEAMKKQFPELLLIRGYVDLGESHWWCETPDGAIVDPTYMQFGGDGHKYKAHDESEPEPIGQCFECGAYLYDEGNYGIHNGNGLCHECTEYTHDVKKMDTVWYGDTQFSYRELQRSSAHLSVM